MFDSGISVKDLIDELRTEVDIALDIPNKSYVEWLNSLQQLLYTEIIKEQKKKTLKNQSPDVDDDIMTPYGIEDWLNSNYFSGSSIDITALGTEGECQPRFEDIHAVYADDTQLIKSTVASGVIFPNTYYKDNNNIGFNTETEPSEITIVYFVKPALITVAVNDGIDDAKVMIPIEFIDIAKAKLRGEAYKLANEDNLAAKWLNDYNTLLETFKAWVAEKSSNFGV